MADKDEEYHFNETETPSAYTTGPNQPRKDRDFQGRKKSRNVILFIAALMALWSIYKFADIFLTQPKKNPKPAVAVVPPKATLSARPPQSIKPQSMQATLSTQQIKDIADQKARLDTLESNIVNLQTTLSDINTKLNDLSTQVSTLSNQAIKPPPPAPTIKKSSRPKQHAFVGRCRSNPPCQVPYSYRLEAAIPGRAWLMRSDGDTLTVSLGDRIPGYGTVIGIDPNDGVVQISSGATIKYRSH